MTRDEKARKAVEVVLSHEGGYRNRPSDPGGETQWGISARTYPELDIRALTRDQAAAIYRGDWWEAGGYHQIGNYGLALKVFDHAVNIGPARAAQFLQAAANEVIQAGHGTAGLLLRVDGELGPLTLHTVNALDPCLVLLGFLRRVRAHYRRCAKRQPDELAGWENRLLECL